MKKLFFSNFVYAVVSLLFIAATSSCKKSSPASVHTSGFSLTVSGVTYTADNDTAFVSGPFTIIAKRDESNANNFKIIEIDLSAFTEGVCSLTPTGYQLNYVTSTGVATSETGLFNISENTGTTISGNFSSSLSGGLIVTGNFTGVPIKP